MGVGGSEWEWMGVSGSGWEWMGVGGSTVQYNPIQLIVCFYNATYAFQSELTLYIWLNVKELF